MKFNQGDIVAYIADPMNTGTDRAYICRVDNAGHDYVNMTHPHTADPTTPGTYYFHVADLDQVVHAVVSEMEDPLDVGDTVEYVGPPMFLRNPQSQIETTGTVVSVAQRDKGPYITAEFVQHIISADMLHNTYRATISGYSSDFVRVRTTPNRPKTLQDVVSVSVSDELAQPVPTGTPEPAEAPTGDLKRAVGGSPQPDELVTARNALVTIDGEANDTRAGLLLAIDSHYDYVDLLAVNMELRDRLYDKDKMGELARTFLAALRKKKDDKNDQMPIVEASETRAKKEDES
jgi:hypothetical protein